MWTLLHRVRRARRGVAAVEFALTFPAVLYLFSGVTDFGLVYYREIALSNAVSAAAQYAEVTGQNTASVTESDVETVLRDAAAQSMPGVQVNANAACYSVSDTATTWSTSGQVVSCSGSSCVTNATTIKYLWISLSATYNAILPLSMVGSPTLSKTIWIPLPC
jgi:Flp pilus assembly protein TadG